MRELRDEDLQFVVHLGELHGRGCVRPGGKEDRKLHLRHKVMHLQLVLRLVMRFVQHGILEGVSGQLLPAFHHSAEAGSRGRCVQQLSWPANLFVLFCRTELGFQYLRSGKELLLDRWVQWRERLEVDRGGYLLGILYPLLVGRGPAQWRRCMRGDAAQRKPERHPLR